MRTSCDIDILVLDKDYPEFKNTLSTVIGKDYLIKWENSDEGAESEQGVRIRATLLEKDVWPFGPNPVPRLGAVPEQGQGDRQGRDSG